MILWKISFNLWFNLSLIRKNREQPYLLYSIGDGIRDIIMQLSCRDSIIIAGHFN